MRVQRCKTQDLVSCFMISWLVGSELWLGGVVELELLFWRIQTAINIASSEMNNWQLISDGGLI